MKILTIILALLIAAVAFFVADLCLAQTAFYRGGVGWTFTGYPLYYTACLLFAWSVNERPAGNAEPR